MEKGGEEVLNQIEYISHAVGGIDGKHIVMKKPQKQAVAITTTRASFPGSSGPGGRRVRIPVDKLWVKWSLLGYTDFQQKPY